MYKIKKGLLIEVEVGFRILVKKQTVSYSFLKELLTNLTADDWLLSIGSKSKIFTIEFLSYS